MSSLALAVAQSTAVIGDVVENVSRHVRLAALAAEHGARLVLFPELSLTGYHLGVRPADALAADDERLQPLQDAARTHEIIVVAGVPLGGPDGLHIGAVTFAPNGAVGTYTKQHLHTGEDIAFKPGVGGAPVLIADQVVGLAICADITHPEHVRAAVSNGATIYAASCLITEDGYATDSALLRHYATDHQILVLMANYGAPIAGWSSAGRSAIWCGNGDLLAEAPGAGEALVVAERRQSRWSGKVVECPRLVIGKAVKKYG